MRPSHPFRPFVVTGGALALGYLAWIGTISSNSTRIHTWPYAFYTDLLCLVPALFLAGSYFQPEGFQRVRREAVWLLAVVIGLGVAHAPHPRFSFSVAILLLGGLAWTVLVADRVASVADRSGDTSIVVWRLVRLAGALLTLPLISALVLWIQALQVGASEDSWKYVFTHFEFFRNPHPFGHWNYTGGYALLTVPWLLTLAVKDRGKMRPIWVVCSTLSLLILVSAFSRGAVLGAGVMLLVAVGSYLARGGVSRGKALMVVLGSCVVVGFLVLGNPRLRDFVVHPTTIAQPNEGDVQRLGMMQGGWQLFCRSPWLGYGPGMTPFVFPAVRGNVVGGVETSFQLHNTALEVAVNLGAAGIVAGAILIWSLVSAARSRAKDNRAAEPLQSLRNASLYSLGGYACVALTDYQFNVPAIVAVCGLHVGVVLGLRPLAVTPAARRSGPWYGCGLLGLTAISAILLVPEWQARHLYWKAWWRTPETDRQLLLQRLHAAADAAPGNPFYRTMSGLQLAEEADKLGATQGAEILKNLARAELSLSSKLDQNQEPIDAALGWLSLRDDPKSAELHFAQALRLIPDRDTLHLGLALSQLAQGQKAQAVHSLALECCVNPEFFSSPLWQAPPLQELRQQTDEMFEHVLTKALAHEAMPSWRKPQLNYLRAWARWWRLAEPPQPYDLVSATPLQRAFFQYLRDPTSSIPPDKQFVGLVLALGSPTDAQTILGSCRPALSAPAIAGALARISVRPKSLDELIRSEPPGQQGIVWERINRLHYNIMARNLDGPGIPDLAPRPVDRFLREFLDFIIPPKGMLPGKVLKSLEIE